MKYQKPKPVCFLQSKVVRVLFGVSVCGCVIHGQEILKSYTDLWEGSSDLGFDWFDDIDGDGHPDFIIGDDSMTSGGGTFVGEVRVYSGLTGALLYAYPGSTTSAYMGYTVASLSDQNGDGIRELAGSENSGGYIWSGKDGSQLFAGPVQRVVEIGDITGDGISEFTGIGATVALFEGGTFDQLYPLPAPPGTIFFGLSTVPVGDVDLDGAPDFAIGAPSIPLDIYCQPGSVWVYSGRTGGLLHSLSLAPSSYFRLFDLFGQTLAGPGDLTGDGIGDVVVGAPWCCEVLLSCGTGLGAIYIYDGLTGEPADLPSTALSVPPYIPLAYPIPQIPAPSGSDEFGETLGSPGDVNGNGFGDLLVTRDTGIGPRQVSLYDGGTRTVIYELDRSFLGPTGSFGSTYADAGDYDGDDFPDYVIASDSAGPSARIDLFSGAPTGVESFGSGCAASTGDVPRIGVSGVPRLGEGFTLYLSRVLPGAQAFLLVGTSSTSWGQTGLPLDLSPFGLAGCELLVAPELVSPAVTSEVRPGEGVASVSFEIPAALGLYMTPLQTTWYAQWLVLEPSSSQGPWATLSRGLQIEFQ